MKSTTIDKALQIFQQHSGRLRSSEAIRLGIAPRTLYALRDSGQIEEMTRGIFQLPGVLVDEQTDLVQVAMRIPRGVICLVSALAFYNLTIQIPRAVYVAMPLGAEKPRLKYPPVRLFWLSPTVYKSGVEEHKTGDAPIRIYSREKTIADCFKFRNKIGLEVALEALREGIRQGCSPAAIMEYARIDRVERILRPYLETLL